ncbi:sortilin-like isoform X2 [Pseudophryne corroboree]|uniref:sortilin-like isoform X2 n=1 Tax=Pseudophryne corroboree TaxID=495146 RepID=UPI003081E5A6
MILHHRSYQSMVNPPIAIPRRYLVQIRIHPGIIAAVVVVALLAVLAAVFIVRKYCCSESNITYRYSVLRRHQEELDNSTTNRLQDDSDEDLLE